MICCPSTLEGPSLVRRQETGSLLADFKMRILILKSGRLLKMSLHRIQAMITVALRGPLQMAFDASSPLRTPRNPIITMKQAMKTMLKVLMTHVAVLVGATE